MLDLSIILCYYKSKIRSLKDIVDSSELPCHKEELRGINTIKSKIIKMYHLNFIQTVLSFVLTVWIVFLGFSFLIGKNKEYVKWTKDSLKAIWKHCWQLIIGIIIGYFLATEQAFDLTVL